MGQLNCGTFQLSYFESGGSGEPVALVHGSWGDHHQWDAVAARMGETYRVISYDRRGHGASVAPEVSVALSDQVSDLSSLLSVVGRGPTHVVAVGAGGIIALQLALLRPDQVRSVNIHEPALIGLISGDPQLAAVYASYRELEARVASRIRGRDGGGGAEMYADGVSMDAGGWSQIPPIVQSTFGANAAVALKESEDPVSQNIDLGLFGGYREPIVLTGGSRSVPVFASINDCLAGAFFRPLRYTFDGVGHFPHVTHPDEFVKVAGEFCRYASER